MLFSHVHKMVLLVGLLALLFKMNMCLFFVMLLMNEWNFFVSNNWGFSRVYVVCLFGIHEIFLQLFMLFFGFLFHSKSSSSFSVVVSFCHLKATTTIPKKRKEVLLKAGIVGELSKDLYYYMSFNFHETLTFHLCVM